MTQSSTTLDVNWAETLTGEMLLVGLLGKLWYEFPDRAWYQSLLAEDVFAEAPFAADQPDVAAGLAGLRGWQRGLGPGGLAAQRAAFDDLAADYTRLFVGPGKLLAPPWESVYFSPNRLIFQEQTLHVRGWYARFGLANSRAATSGLDPAYAGSSGREPDDHVGLELAFVAHLASLGLAALEAGEAARLAETLDAQRAFLEAHLLQWAPDWCGQVEAKAATAFYQSAARLTRGALAALARLPARPAAAAVA
jgi:TorA maturation chaperone TorD